MNRLTMPRKLPELSATGIRVIERVPDPHVELGAVVAAIGAEPDLAEKFVRIANSPLYVTQRKIDNLRKALMLFGLNATLTLYTSATTRAARNRCAMSRAI